MKRLLTALAIVAALCYGGSSFADEPKAPEAAAAAAAPPAPSSSEPSVITNAQINSGDTAWMLSSTALVLLMTIPGLALFYG
ncbi:MAG: hypothetical protein ACREUV_04875, partial [Burkholderiales bacterium]